MPGAIWDGVIAFGLVSIPIRLRAATGSHDLSLHQYHAADGGRIRYQKVCELDGEVVEPDDIAKGTETDDGDIVLLDDDDFADLPVSTSKTIEVIGFIPAEKIDPIFYERSYYAEPGKAAARPYALLRESLVDSGRIAVVRVTLRRRESLAALLPREDVLVLHTMVWPDEIREPEASGLGGEAKAAELKMAAMLIDSMAMDEFHPEDYTDDYQEALYELIEAKAHGRTLKAKVKAEPKAKVIDLMEALAKSVDQAKSGSGRRRPAKQAVKQTAKKAAKKATAKKTAKKSAARKTTAKKAPAAKRKSA
ncbi:non-homologous end joining protein Ku [Glycomyces niveus]|uniref:Non-homologous end joining protein Ku n=1 Tax=Glycomyces niveus TaxID=2820287 RepID=A0ABS3U0N3_9ACTN|nr:Ku protein [Glycomyces sp. NEAU-S30]MBO3732330.1 Ku protein [Glycomyces sp. NEAU-S30]